MIACTSIRRGKRLSGKFVGGVKCALAVCQAKIDLAVRECCALNGDGARWWMSNGCGRVRGWLWQCGNPPEIGFWRGICLNVCTKMVFVLTRRGCLLRVHFSRHGIDTLSLGEIRQDVKNVVDLWIEGEHNRSSRLKKTTWLHGETKVSGNEKKWLTSKAKGSINAPRD